MVVGAAGSGKSRVLAERVVRTLETARPSAPPRVLVTAFNQSMVDQLAAWIEERMRASRLLSNVSANHRHPGWTMLGGSVGAIQTSVRCRTVTAYRIVGSDDDRLKHVSTGE